MKKVFEWCRTHLRFRFFRVDHCVCAVIFGDRCVVIGVHPLCELDSRLDDCEVTYNG
nr:hypothetical protein KCFLNJMA_KCFLNJMA_CDS_0004 [Microvirus sp.]